MRQRYFVPGLRALVRATAKSCQWCRNRRAIPRPPEMGHLPKERFAILARPFTNTGIDFFGPFEIAVGRLREKRWGVLFTCLTIRAVNIELSLSLSTDTFLLTLKQFMARRGVPKCIWSDNGTHFRGASRVLQEEIQRLSCGEVERHHPKIKWNFITPAAPHMGGEWERMVRSVKSILMDILEKANLREEALRATLADVEHILNSRPLTYVPLDTPEMDALTLNHFLLGSSNGIRDSDETRGNGSTLTKIFRWIREYLPCLTRCGKWFERSSDPIGLDDVVIIVDDNAKRNTWRKGIVIYVYLGNDGEVRSAVVKTTDLLVTTIKLPKLDVKEQAS
ncbi:PREDICTED: uncharacterized protein LOC108362476 [Rhagoletis zephyria]|uniref:uncharacterized protein LOC108362476 n=1 Tax=Rhagoletis zephyria TaxID=28612 RepID=UPI0008117CA8|nr:PREDICTED: uncharacterized protein LOC108362476 [Rhagoletis zephyria]